MLRVTLLSKSLHLANMQIALNLGVVKNVS